MSAQPLPRISPAQYLETERAAEIRSEYYDGQVYAMSGGSYAHAVVMANLSRTLGQALLGRPCSVTSNDLRLRVSPEGLYTYPDVMVVCGEPRFADSHNDTLLNPILIAEVLSKTTEAHDRGFKFAQYRKLDSFEEYLLVSQSEPRIEKFGRQPSGQWVLSECVGLEAVCRFESVDCQIPLADIYYRVAFAT